MMPASLKWLYGCGSYRGCKRKVLSSGFSWKVGLVRLRNSSSRSCGKSGAWFIRRVVFRWGVGRFCSHKF